MMADPAAAPVMALCPSCGWRYATTGPCARCEFLAARPRRMGLADAPEPVTPFTDLEKLYLGAALLQEALSETERGELTETARLMAVAARLHVRRLHPPTPYAGGASHAVELPIRDVRELPDISHVSAWQYPRIPMGSTPSVLRTLVTRCAQHWKQLRYPLTPGDHPDAP